MKKKRAARDEPRGEIEEAPPWWRRAWAFLRKHYSEIDLRTVGLFRIVLGLLLALNTLRCWGEAYWLYDNEGVLSNHAYLFRPNGNWHFSLFLSFGSPGEVHVAFALTLIAHLVFMVGWHARVMSVVSFVLATSLDSRLVLVENGGYIVVNLLALWAMFLPTDRRFSVDAWLRSWRERHETTEEELRERWLPDDASRPHRSVIHAAVILNLALIYFLNAVNKAGHLWRSGDTLHYVLHLDRMVTGLGVWFREHMDWAGKPLSWWVLSCEALLPPLILAPFGRRLTRPLAQAIGISLHVPFGLFMRLGPFSWFMIAWGFLLPSTEVWDALEAWYRGKVPPVRLALADRPLGWALGRLVARLDKLGLVEIAIDREEGAPLARATRGEAEVGAREIARAMPPGILLWPLLQIGTLGVAGRSLAILARLEAPLTRLLGLPRAARVLPANEPGLYAQRPPEGPAARDDEAVGGVLAHVPPLPVLGDVLGEPDHRRRLGRGRRDHDRRAARRSLHRPGARARSAQGARPRSLAAAPGLLQPDPARQEPPLPREPPGVLAQVPQAHRQPGGRARELRRVLAPRSMPAAGVARALQPRADPDLGLAEARLPAASRPARAAAPAPVAIGRHALRHEREGVIRAGGAHHSFQRS
jgi:hypothetical protein